MARNGFDTEKHFQYFKAIIITFAEKHEDNKNKLSTRSTALSWILSATCRRSCLHFKGFNYYVARCTSKTIICMGCTINELEVD